MKKTISVLMIVLAVAAGILVSRIEDKTGDNSTTITNVNCSELGKNIFFTIDLMQFCEEDSEYNERNPPEGYEGAEKRYYNNNI